MRGRANLLEDASAADDLGRVRDLFAELERSENLLNVLDTAREAEGVRLFIGSENPLFSLSGSAMIVAPYMNAERKVVGALGVIGPTRLNYARVIPVVDYTARVVGRVLDGRGGFAWAMNTPGMYRAHQSAGGQAVIQIFADEE